MLQYFYFCLSLWTEVWFGFFGGGRKKEAGAGPRRLPKKNATQARAVTATQPREQKTTTKVWHLAPRRNSNNKQQHNDNHNDDNNHNNKMLTTTPVSGWGSGSPFSSSSASTRRERRHQQREASALPGARLLPSSGAPFLPTSTARLDATAQELGTFASSVRCAHLAALSQADSLNALAARLRAAMAVPLPRVWAPVDGSPSMTEPKAPQATHDFCSGRVGGGSSVVDEAAALAAAAEASHQLRACVAGPLERWLDALDVASARLESVERARLGLDAARREAEERFAQDEVRAHQAFAALRDPTAAAAAAGGGGGGGGGGGAFGAEPPASSSQYGSGLFGGRRRRQGGLFGGGGIGGIGNNGGLFSSAHDTNTITPASAAVGPASARGALFVEQARAAELEEASLRRAQLDRALAAVRASYEEQEGLAFAMLRGLAVDSARLKSYYAAALLTAMHACQRLALALGPAKLPLPGFDDGESAGGGTGVGAAEPPPSSSSSYGRIGGVEAQVLEAAPLARELARGRLPPSELEAGGGGRAAAAAGAAWPVVVRRAVATPMAVGADSALEAREPFGGGGGIAVEAAALPPFGGGGGSFAAGGAPPPLTAATGGAATTVSTTATTPASAAGAALLASAVAGMGTTTTKRPAAAMVAPPPLKQQQQQQQPLPRLAEEQQQQHHEEEEFMSATGGARSRQSSFSSATGAPITEGPATGAMRAALA
jgi:hypothetical protein